MNKFLYFASGAPDGTAGTEEVILVPVENVSHFEMDSATRLNIHLKGVEQEKAADGTDASVVGLTVTSGKYKEALQDIVASINAHPNGDPFVVIADGVNSVFASAHITAVAAISVIDAS